MHFLRGISVTVIPLREKMGNYDLLLPSEELLRVIPLREKMGNYDPFSQSRSLRTVIPLREKMGNYDLPTGGGFFYMLYHYERKWGTTTSEGVGQENQVLYHYERKWGTMVFAPMPKNDFPHIISPFSACVNPQTEGAGVAGCPGGFGIYLTKGETLGKLELHKT